jgi:GT2 family glycosyltransferase
MLRCHVVVPTHTTRHLQPCLVSLAQQSHPPDSIVVTCDTDDAAIADLLDQTREALGQRLPRLVHVSRAHTGVARLNQVRNNGLRALDSVVSPADGDLIVVLDGDTMLAPDTIERHVAGADRGADVIIPFRVNLDEKTTDQVVRSPLDLPDLRDLVTEADTRLLFQRHRRYQRQLLLRRLFPAWLGVVKAHKPKVLGGHHAVRVGVMRRVNGYDEGYVGYGYDDDDLTRRLHQLRPRVGVSIAVKESLSFHLWHPTRAPQRPTEAPGYARFVRTDLPTHAELGWTSPGDQPEVRVREVE